jgi:hypothetical protein
MAHDLRELPSDSSQGWGPRVFSEHDLVQMKPPASPILGVVVDGEPLPVGGVRYWLVAWVFGNERRVTWSPESAIRLR